MPKSLCDLFSLMKPSILGIFALLWSLHGSAQFQEKVDSLKEVLGNLPEDTQKVKVLNRIGAYLATADLNESENYLLKGRKLATKLSYDEGLAHANMVLGSVTYRMGNFPEALQYHLASLSILEDLGNSKWIGDVYINLGLVYAVQKEFENARLYYDKALVIKQELGDQQSIAGIYSNLGLIEEKVKDYDKSLEYFQKALDIRKNQGDPVFLADSYATIANVYYNTDQNDSALAMYGRIQRIYESIGYEERVALMAFNIGSTHLKMGNHREGISHLNKASAMFKELDMKDLIKASYQMLADAHELDGNYEQGYTYYKLYASLKDSLFNEDKSKEIGKLEAKFEFEKAEEEWNRMEEERLKTEASAEGRRNNLQYSGILMFLVLLGAGVIGLGKMSVPIRLVEGLIFFTFLLFFEFCLVLLDPYIEQFSSGEPAYKLMFNALLAGLIFPLHSLIENKVKSRLLSP